MPVFGTIKSDSRVFTGDNMRFEVSTRMTPDLELAQDTFYEMSFDAGTTWFDISESKQIDWIYSTAGEKTVTLKVTTTVDTAEFTKTITVLDLTTAKLFSNDADLYPYEPDVNSYLPTKWDGWNIIHLEAQKQIMQWIEDKGLVKKNGAKYVVADLHDIAEVRELSIMKAFVMIFQGNSNQVGDVFSNKAEKYEAQASLKASKALIRLDYNSDGVADASEVTDLRIINVIRR